VRQMVSFSVWNASKACYCFPVCVSCLLYQPRNSGCLFSSFKCKHLLLPDLQSSCTLPMCPKRQYSWCYSLQSSACAIDTVSPSWKAS
jgi:hypothetical protein